MERLPFSNSTAWAFHNPTRIVFGCGQRSQLAGQLHGKLCLVVTTQRGRLQMEGDELLAAALKQADQIVWLDNTRSNPDLTELQDDIDAIAGRHFDVVVGFGGGSCLDAAKAFSVCLARSAVTRDLRRLIDEPALHDGIVPLPLIAMPTTSGTGSEVTSFATIWDHSRKRKLSLAGPAVSPKLAIVDPEVSFGLPWEVTRYTGLDALNQAFESVWNRNASPATRQFAARAVKLALPALPLLKTDIDDKQARVCLAEASLFAGLCISQTRTAICHSISYPITAHFEVPHGLACAFTMGAVAELCAEGAPFCLDEMAIGIGLPDGGHLVANLQSLLEELDVHGAVRRQVPSLDALLALRNEMYTPGRSDNFILSLTDANLTAILTRSYASQCGCDR